MLLDFLLEMSGYVFLNENKQREFPYTSNSTGIFLPTCLLYGQLLAIISKSLSSVSVLAERAVAEVAGAAWVLAAVAPLLADLTLLDGPKSTSTKAVSSVDSGYHYHIERMTRTPLPDGTALIGIDRY